MRAIFFIAIALVLAAPGLSSAQCREASTVAGGVGGALIGNSIARGGGGAIGGGLVGALVGNQIAKNNCPHHRADYRAECRWETHYRHHHSYRVQVCTR